MHVGFKTDKGIIRSSNEDACFVLLHDKVYILADGVGGGNSGEIASRTAVARSPTMWSSILLTDLKTSMR